MRIVLAGGAQLYAQTMPLARQLDIAYVHRAVDGDAYFPAIYRSIWHETAREEHAAPAALAPRRDFATAMAATTSMTARCSRLPGIMILAQGGCLVGRCNPLEGGPPTCRCACSRAGQREPINSEWSALAYDCGINRTYLSAVGFFVAAAIAAWCCRRISGCGRVSRRGLSC